MTVDCTICLGSVKQVINCGNYFCNCVYCEDCFKEYIKLCMGDQHVIKCGGCVYEFPIKRINRYVDPQTVEKYKVILFKYLYNKYINKVEDNLKQKEFIEKIRKDKIEFLDNAPPGLQFIIKNVLTTKYNEVMKVNKKVLEQNSLSSSKNCFNLFCTGYLDNDFTCIVCADEFCKDCEQKKVTTKHKCKQEDIDSINEIKDIICCPNCKVKVVKSEGCNFITCARCETNFCISDGTRSIGGNHKQYTKITDKKHTLPEQYRDEYYDDKGIYEKLQIIETKFSNGSKLDDKESSFVKFLSDKKKEEAIKSYQNYKRILMMNYIKQKCYDYINEEYEKSGLTPEFLDQIIQIF